MKREASLPIKLSATNYKLTAALYMQIFEVEEDRKHREIDYSPSDVFFLTSLNVEKSKLYFFF
jgi:hypothetical protein